MEPGLAEPVLMLCSPLFDAPFEYQFDTISIKLSEGWFIQTTLYSHLKSQLDMVRIRLSEGWFV